MAKQLLIDVLIVLVTPILLIGGYYVFKTDGTQLLDVVPSFVGTQNEVDPELGKKTEAALALLSGIHLDDSIFTDPAYLMLKKYTVQIPSVELGRSNPFTSPQVLIDMNRSGGRIPVGLR